MATRELHNFSLASRVSEVNIFKNKNKNNKTEQVLIFLICLI